MRTLYIAAIAEHDEDGELYSSIIVDEDPQRVVESVNGFFKEEARSGHNVIHDDFVKFEEMTGFDAFDDAGTNHYRIMTDKKTISMSKKEKNIKGGKQHQAAAADVITKAYFMPGIETIRDSMQLDSGQEIANIEGVHKGHKFEVSVLVHGEVRVIFRDKVYKCASRMPKELLDCYATGSEPDMVAESDGKEYETPYYVDMNNWFEEVIFIDGDEVSSELVDISNKSEDDWKDILFGDAKEEIELISEDGKKENHRVLIIWGSDLHDVPDMKEHVLARCRKKPHF